MGRKADDVAGRAVRVAAKVLKREAGYLEDLRTHDFRDDESAHDDALVERLYAEFVTAVGRVQAALTEKYGPPARVGRDGDRAVGLNGVFRFALWKVGGKRLYVAAHHEDRGLPIILWLGTVAPDA
jgi:hypothetical protein